jgi:hypothetical protein
MIQPEFHAKFAALARLPGRWIFHGLVKEGCKAPTESVMLVTTVLGPAIINGPNGGNKAMIDVATCRRMRPDPD